MNTKAHQTQNIAVNEIIPGDNDRTVFDNAGLQDLASSIENHGLAQPITVRPIYRCPDCGEISSEPFACPHGSSSDPYVDAEPCYQIVAGERRFRAFRLLQLDTIPAHVRQLDDEAASAIMLAENVGRQDLDPIDEGLAYHKRMEQFGWSVEDVAEHAGVSTIRVRFRIKLLDLRSDVQKLVRDGQLKMGYAQVLSDTGLDGNRQLIALKRLRDNPRPTTAWFRTECNQLKEEQCQDALFDASIFTVAATEAEEGQFQAPPSPDTTEAPKVGDTLIQIIRNQIAFWSEAADAWNSLGKPFKRQECEAAAAALSALVG